MNDARSPERRLPATTNSVLDDAGFETSSRAEVLAFPTSNDAPRAAADVPAELIERARRVAAVAAKHAEDVDRAGRFPQEAIAALRQERLFAASVPQHLGGQAASLGDLVEICYVLGQACASTAMIFAMHQIKVACVVRHAQGAGWHEEFLRRLAEHQWLVASSTTEGLAGGAVRTSLAPIVEQGGAITLDRAATVMSYGAQADAVVTTARRDVAASASDQVLVVFERGHYSLERTGEWDTLGMRGTCSAGFALKAAGVAAQVLPEPYAVIHAQTMTPTAHLLWSAVWTGIAASAFERARMFVRRAARTNERPPGAVRLSRAAAALRTLRALLASTLARYEQAADIDGAPDDLALQSALTLLKADISDLAVEAVSEAMRTCGLAGYRNDGEASLGRHLRDVLSAPLMINNERLYADAASMLLLTPAPPSIRG